MTTDNDYQGFMWKGKQCRTIGELGAAAAAVKTEEEGAAFLAAYSAINEYAAKNIGYVAGYYDPETAQRIYRLCGVAHPIFGTSNPTPEEAFAAGQKMGKEIMDEGRKRA